MRPYDLTLPAEEDLIDIWSYCEYYTYKHNYVK